MQKKYEKVSSDFHKKTSKRTTSYENPIRGTDIIDDSHHTQYESITATRVLVPNLVLVYEEVDICKSVSKCDWIGTAVSMW